ncbi:Retrotransposon gag protein [Popillia japonica]|uniref:Retrotransposon gag protein n=1 Tax=Popillia japonica TaxID=7064 RepID=A0AAW1HR56_POPJA
MKNWRIRFALKRIGRLSNAALSSELMALALQMNEKLEDKIRLKVETIPIAAKLESTRLEESSPSDEEVLSPNTFNNTPNSCSSSNRTVPVWKWNLKFSGTRNSLSVGAFLQRVDELSSARRIDEQQLFALALDLFEGNALKWYRGIRQTVHSWNDLVKKLKEDFLPADYEDKLLDEVRRRSQAPDETISVYLAIMSEFFSRFSAPLPETLQLRILMSNIAPFYQSHLGLMEVTSIEQLKNLCQKLEARRSSIATFTAPVKPDKHCLEPELAYLSSESQETASAAIVTSPPDRRACFNCGRSGHLVDSCTEPKQLKCYRCGRSGFTSRNCPGCQGNGPRRT